MPDEPQVVPTSEENVEVDKTTHVVDPKRINEEGQAFQRQILEAFLAQRKKALEESKTVKGPLRIQNGPPEKINAYRYESNKVFYPWVRKIGSEIRQEEKSDGEGFYTVILPNDKKQLIKHHFVLTDKIVHRTKELKSGKVVDRYTIVGKGRDDFVGEGRDDFLGEGAFGEVYKAQGTLKKRKDLEFNNKKSRAVKFQSTKKYPMRDTAGNVLGLRFRKYVFDEEVKLLQSAPHFHAKEITIENAFSKANEGEKVSQDLESYMVMEKFSGETLFQFLEEKKDLSIDDRFKITINLIRALKEQLHDQNIVHLDITCSNIMIDPDTLNIKFIDLGSAAFKETTDIVGTPKYVAPEHAKVLEHEAVFNAKSDIYSLGIVLAEVWNAKMPKPDPNKEEEFINKKASVEEVDFPGLFIGIPVNENDNMEFQEPLKDCLHKMTSRRQDARPDEIELLENVYDIYFDYQIKTNVEEASACKKASEQGLVLYQKLNHIKMNSKAFNYFDIQRCLLDAIETLPANASEKAIGAFLSAADIHGFPDFQTKQDLYGFTQNTINKFISQLNALFNMAERVERLQLSVNECESLSKDDQLANLKFDVDQLEEDVTTMIDKEAKRQFKFDSYVELNKRYENSVHELKENLNELEEQVNGHVEKVIGEPLNGNNENDTHTFYDNAMKTMAINIMKTNDMPFYSMKKKVKDAIQAYRNETLTDDNITKRQRAASQNRKDDIAKIVKLFDDNVCKNPFDFSNKLYQIANEMKDTRFGSALKNKILKIVDVYKIDPANFDEKEGEILSQILRAQLKKNNQVIRRGMHTIEVPHPDQPDKKLKRTILLTRDIIYRPKDIYHGSKKVKTVPRYSVLSSMLGKGCQGEVFNVLGTLKHNGESMVLSTKHARVLKSVSGFLNARNEANYLKQTPHAGVKNVTNESMSTRHIVMNKLGDMNLRKFIDNKLHSLSVKERLILSANLVRALKEQIHDRGLYHSDLKPENIRIDSKTFAVYIVDLGQAAKQKEEGHRFRGGHLYFAPEALTPFATIEARSDIYSMGLVVSEIWGAKRRSGRMAVFHGQQEFTNMFSGLKGFADEAQETRVLDHLRGMTARKKDVRKSLDESIGFFNKELLASGEEKNAYDMGYKVFEALNMQVFSNSLYTEKENLQTYAEKNLGAIEKRIQEGNSLPNDATPESIKAFTKSMDVKILSNLTPNEIVVKVRDIKKEYLEQLNLLLDLKSSIDKLNQDYSDILVMLSNQGTPQEKAAYKAKQDELSNLTDAVYKLFNKLKSRQNKLDDYNELTMLFKEKIPGLSQSAEFTSRVYIADENIKKYKSIFSEAPTNPTDVDRLKALIRATLKTYLHDYAVSIKCKTINKVLPTKYNHRQDDVFTVLGILSKNDTVYELETALDAHLRQNPASGFFGNTLKKKIKQTVDRFNSSKAKMSEKIAHGHS